LKAKKSIEAEDRILEEKLKERREKTARSKEADEKQNKAQPDDDQDEEPIITSEKPSKQSLEKKIEIEKAALDLKKEVLDTRVSQQQKEKDFKKLHNEADEKKKNEKENKDDPIITYLSLIASHHSSKLDR